MFKLKYMYPFTKRIVFRFLKDTKKDQGSIMLATYPDVWREAIVWTNIA